MNNKSAYPNNLRFRRQFILGPKLYSPDTYWKAEKLKQDLYLSVHTDLDYFSYTNGNNTIILIGIAVDCKSPFKTPQQICEDLLGQNSSIDTVIQASKPLAGRWAIIYQNIYNTFIFTDPCAQRSVHYFKDGEETWCASQPTLINEIHELSVTDNKDLLAFVKSDIYKAKQSKWFSNKTWFNNCYRLLPNHYLDYKTAQSKRFYPDNLIQSGADINQCAEEAALYLRNIINGLNSSHKLKFALTSGFDSRILLAASCDVSDSVSYFVDRLGVYKNHHDDIYIPKNLAKKFNLNFSILDAQQHVPDWFGDLLTKNIPNARVSPMIQSVKSIYSRLDQKDADYVIVNGNITEILRIKESKLKFDPLIDNNAGVDNVKHLLKFTGFESKFLEDEITNWAKTIDVSLIPNATVLDLFYWELQMGNWAALDPAEKDVATEQVSPFNCRTLMETCLKVPREDRMAPGYLFFREIVKQLWPETLSEPLNPGPKTLEKIKRKVRKTVTGLINVIRKFV